jgi:hypothetical protein
MPIASSPECHRHLEVSQLSLKCNMACCSVSGSTASSPVAVLDSAYRLGQLPGALLRTLVAQVWQIDP